MTAELSAAIRTLPGMTPNPWRRLGDEWPQVTVTHAPLRRGLGLTRWFSDGRPPEIVLHDELRQVKRRCVLAHEIEHLEYGAPCETLRARNEQLVVNATARYLLPSIEVIADAAAVYDLRRAADELWVTWQVLVDRLRVATDSELDYIAQRREGAA